MELTAIIACQNRHKNLELCIHSISLCIPRPQLIIVDFGSTPPLKPIKRMYPWVHYIAAKNNTSIFHKARALNIGIRKSETKYVCLTDADQLFQPNFFGVVSNAVSTTKKFVMCSTFFLPHISSKINAANYTTQTYKNLLKGAKRSKKKPHGEGCCNAIDRKWLVTVRGHNEEYIGWGFEDKDIALRAKLSNYVLYDITAYTSMVHLPHERNYTYFNKNLRLKNEKRYKETKKGKKLIVNNAKKWGIL